MAVGRDIICRAGFEKPRDVANLSQDHLKKYVRDEFEVFKDFLKVIIA